MDYKEAAEYLHITPGTLRNWVSSGKIKPLKQPGEKGRVLFSQAELEEWLEQAACRSIKTESFRLQNDKRLRFDVLLFSPADECGSSILATISEIAPDESKLESFVSLHPEELQAIGKAFFQAAEDRKSAVVK